MSASSSLPTGTVTFLFTDVEGSTRLVQSLGQRWPAILADHNDLLRRAITAHGGTVIKTQGDGFFAVFSSPTDAILAAVDAQRAIGGHAWPADAEVRVRIGIHTGTGSLGGDDYVGIDVHRAARIAAAAHGGQVILSEATAILAETELGTGYGLRDLGKHRLKDLAQAETIFQITGPGLATDFPRLRTLDAIPNNLPMQVTSFVGRHEDLVRATELFDAARVLTITGAGGTGKTRLSLELGAELGSRFRDGVFFADLAPVHDPDVVPSQILHSLGGQASAGAKPPTEALFEQLADREVLLILDNFEQVIGAAPIVAELVKRSPRSKFLVTSRSPLRIAAEQEMPLEPMALPDAGDPRSLAAFDAVTLFVERAAAVRPDFRLTEENAPAVAELVRRLDGLPLAIELVASRVRLLPVATILARLDPSSLGSGAVDLPERQRTIEGAIAWSHDLLEPPVRELFARLGVFAGGAGLPEIEEVCDDVSIDVVDGLGELIDQSLLRRLDDGDEARFRMLHVIREFALARLAETGVGDRVHLRHLQAYTTLADKIAPHLLSPERKEWLDRFDRDHDNVRSALDWAVARTETDLALRLAAASWRFWQSRGFLREGERRLEAALGLPGGEPLHRARALEALGGVYWWEGEIDACVAQYERALEIQRQSGEPAELANALYNLGLALGVVERVADELPAARDRIYSLFDEAEEIYRGLGQLGGLGDVAWGRGNAIAYLDEYPPAALEQFKISIDFYRQAGNDFGMGWGMFEVANFSRRHGDYSTARTYLAEGLALFARHRDVSAAVLFMSLAAALATDGGNPEGAARLAGAYHSLRIASGTNLVDHEINRVDGLDYESAEALTGDLGEAYREGRRLDFDGAVAYTMELLGELRLEG